LDFLDRHIGRATDNGYQLRLYLALLLGAAFAAAFLFSSVAVALAMLKLPWWSGAPLALGSTGALAYRVVTRARRDAREKVAGPPDDSAVSIDVPVP
jgi:hypothetical protein